MTKKLELGDVVSYMSYGTLHRGRIIASMRGRIFQVEELDGTRAGSIGWIHVDSILKES